MQCLQIKHLRAVVILVLVNNYVMIRLRNLEKEVVAEFPLVIKKKTVPRIEPMVHTTISSAVSPLNQADVRVDKRWCRLRLERSTARTWWPLMVRNAGHGRRRTAASTGTRLPTAGESDHHDADRVGCRHLRQSLPASDH